MLFSVSLFSGCLGLDLGLEKVGIQARVFVEKDPVCQETIRLNRTAVPILSDIFAVTGQDILRETGGQVPDLVVGGPPCQSFSSIGKRQFLKDVRGQAILEYLRLVGELKPRYFVMENVPGILRATRNGRPLLPWLIGQFKKLGYRTNWQQVNAADFGAPQKRIRVVVIGARDGEAPILTPTVTHPRTLWKAIGDLEKHPGVCGAFSPKMASFLAKIPAGGNWKSLSVLEQKAAMGKTNLTTGGCAAFYRRLHYDRPAPTLLTSPTQRATTLCHPAATRPLSIAEYRRIQGFPDTWKLAGNLARQYQQLGNAVPVELAQAIGEAIVRNSKGEN